MSGLLEAIRTPEDLRAVPAEKLPELAAEIRGFLIEHVCLTGRQSLFPTLRQRGGLSGYPNRAESEHDWIENSHASTALSYADGLAKALRRQERAGTVLAFVGDGSLTGGMAWEALNNIAADDELPLVILVNDNGRSYTPTVGGLARQLSGLRTNPHYEQILDVVKRNVSRAP